MPFPRRTVAACLLALPLVACQPAHTARDASQRIASVVDASPRPTPTATPATPAPQPTPIGPVSALPPSMDSPQSVAQALVDADRTLHTAGTSDRDITAAAHLQQSAVDAVVVHQDWRDAVVAAVPPPLHDAAASDIDAAVELRRLNGSTDTLPHWHIVPAPPADSLLAWYHEAERTSGVPWAYFAAINLVETHMGRIQGDSVVGAQGPMQFMPATWEQYGRGDVHDPHAAILGAARFLSAAGGPADIHGAVYQYNPSELYVDAVTRYAQRMLADPQAFPMYYRWQVDIAMPSGEVILPEGFAG